MKKKAELLL